MKELRIVVSIFAMLALAVTIVAHHSSAGEFDPKATPITLAGVITKVELRNPHCDFYLDVSDQRTGKTDNWRVEYGGAWAYPAPAGAEIPSQSLPNGVVLKPGSKAGLLRTTDETAMFGGLKPGAVVSVTGIRARDGGFRLSFKTLRDRQGKAIIG
jgi:hypothetical protein